MWYAGCDRRNVLDHRFSERLFIRQHQRTRSPQIYGCLRKGDSQMSAIRASMQGSALKRTVTATGPRRCFNRLEIVNNRRELWHASLSHYAPPKQRVPLVFKCFVACWGLWGETHCFHMGVSASGSPRNTRTVCISTAVLREERLGAVFFSFSRKVIFLSFLELRLILR